MLEATLSRSTFRNNISDIFCLCKTPIAFFSVLAAVSGLFSAARPSGIVFLSLTAGVFLMSSGAGALNQYEERRTDARMARTARRPIPSGKIRPGKALLIAVGLIGSGATILLFTGTPAPSLLGLVAVCWYNGFYTWFKTRSSIAFVPGALVGAFPPAMGWLAGGGNLFDLRLAALCFFFFIWQVLHFIVHMLTYAGEYEKADLPTLSAIFTQNQLKRLAFQWVMATAASALLIGWFNVIQAPVARFAIFAVSLRLIFTEIAFLGNRQNISARLFRETNYYVLLVMALTVLDGYFRFSAGG